MGVIRLAGLQDAVAEKSGAWSSSIRDTYLIHQTMIIIVSLCKLCSDLCLYSTQTDHVNVISSDFVNNCCELFGKIFTRTVQKPRCLGLG